MRTSRGYARGRPGGIALPVWTDGPGPGSPVARGPDRAAWGEYPAVDRLNEGI